MGEGGVVAEEKDGDQGWKGGCTGQGPQGLRGVSGSLVLGSPVTPREDPGGPLPLHTYLHTTRVHVDTSLGSALLLLIGSSQVGI